MIRSFNRIQRNTAETSLLPGSHTWRASLLPYDLLAIQISDTRAKIESVIVHCPPSLCGGEGALKRKVEELAQRIHTTTRSGVIWDKQINADFESPADTAGKITGWQCFGTSLTAQLDSSAVCKGQRSVKLTNGATEPGTFVSQPLAIPLTGRLGVSMSVGISADCQTLPMAVVLSGKHQDKPFHRIVPVGDKLMPRLANVEPKNGVRWHELIVPFERLPTESLEEVRVGVQYVGSGTVWLDDVKLYPVLFAENEVIELQKMLIVADQRCSSGRVSDLISLLASHWIRFLDQHVPAPHPQAMMAAAKPPIQKTAAAPPPKPTWYQRASGWLGVK
jgi:hypothetical protein